MKKVLKVVLGVLLAVIAAALLFLGFLTVREYRPEDIESLEICGEASGKAVPMDKEITVLSWNAGYCALGKETDFIMDGGGKAPAADRAQVERYISGIRDSAEKLDADIYMFQEIDEDSSRSFHINQRDVFSFGQSAYGINYKCDFVPFPWPPFGKILSGVQTTTGFDIEAAERHSLPCPFTWPLKTANLKRSMLLAYLPVEGSEKKLAVINFHLEAYDSGEGKIAQTKKLLELVENEYSKGNYVIAGGDWNQTFPETLEKYPNNHEDLWAVGLIDDGAIPDGWTLAFDPSAPTCRLLNQPYDPEDTDNTQYYVIDGFLCSPNVRVVSVETVDENFENSDHNPVRMTVVCSGD